MSISDEKGRLTIKENGDFPESPAK